MAKAGDKLPDVKLFEGTPEGEVSLSEVFKGKKGIIFGVPAAFSPGCSKSHLPGYVKDFEKFKEAGAEVIVCTSTDNVFALAAWGKEHNADGKVRMLADPQGKLAEALGVKTDIPPMGIVSKRYSAVIDNGVIKTFNLEGDGFGLSCSLSQSTIGQLKSA